MFRSEYVLLNYHRKSNTSCLPFPCSLKVEYDKLANEKTEMQRHYVMVRTIIINLWVCLNATASFLPQVSRHRWWIPVVLQRPGWYLFKLGPVHLITFLSEKGDKVGVCRGKQKFWRGSNVQLLIVLWDTPHGSKALFMTLFYPSLTHPTWPSGG